MARVELALGENGAVLDGRLLVSIMKQNEKILKYRYWPTKMVKAPAISPPPFRRISLTTGPLVTGSIAW